MAKKLLTILAEKMEIVSKQCDFWTQSPHGVVLCHRTDGQIFHNGRFEIAEDYEKALVTRAQWEAERARIAANQQAKDEAREIARTGAMTNEEQELADIACGKRSKEDQALWDKVATDLFVRWSMESDCENVRKETIKKSMASADAFMAERAKRMKG